MNSLLALLAKRPLLACELLVASLFLNVLALAPPLFFILVFNRYVFSGFDGTLITLSVGMVVAVVFKSAFGLARHRLAEELAGEGGGMRLHQAFAAVLRARAQVLEALQALQARQAALSPQNIGAVLNSLGSDRVSMLNCQVNCSKTGRFFALECSFCPPNGGWSPIGSSR